MKLRFIFSILLALVAFSSFSKASDFEKPLRFNKKNYNHKRGNEHSEKVTEVRVGNPSYGGSGCPQGTLRVSFAPDYLSFSILFDQFVSEVYETEDMRKDTMSCDSIIPMQAPEGMQMEITSIDLRGFAMLPDPSANAVLHSVINFRGPHGDGDRMNLRYTFRGPMTEDYQLSSADIANAKTEVSPCGGRFQLRIANQLRVVSRTPGSGAMLALDSIDGSSNATYYVNWKSCRAQSRRK